ncbi:MAG: PAS domain S-box protein [Elusimicrobia bacterium]|nr:PAS domain S-box protein [Elusimicrobiota bacterium]
MGKPSVMTQDAVSLGKALQAMLATAFSPDNFEPFLCKALKILAEYPAVGQKTGLAIVLKGAAGAPPKGFFLKITAADKGRLLAGKRPAAGKGLCFQASVCLANRKAGQLTAVFGVAPQNPFAVNALLGMAAQFVSARLQAESRDAELRAEKDIAAAVKHVEELYLAFPGISMEEISRAVLDEARRMTGSAFGFTGHIDPATGWLMTSALTTETCDKCQMMDKPVVFKDFNGLWGWVLKKKKALLTNTAPQDRRAVGLPHGHIKIARFLGVPAMSGRKLLGLIALANPSGDYSPRDLETAQKLALVYAIILQRKLEEDKQREEDARFRAIVSSSKDIIYTVNLDGTITYVSPRVEHYGYKPEDLVGRNAVEIAHPDDQDFVAKALVHFAKTGVTMPILPYRVRRKDGTYFYAEQKSSVVLRDGKPAYATGVMRDVTEQKRTEMRLKESEELMRRVFDTAKDAIFVKDMNGMYIKVNKACADLMGTSPEAMIGRSDTDYLPPETAADVFRTDSEVVRTGNTLTLNHLRPFPAGARYVHIIKTPLRNVGGEIIGLLGVARDISDLKKMESELAIARAADAVSKVARPMAHDFNNALAAINGYATLIDDGLNDSSPIKKEISQIIKAVKRAADLTSKFQDFARNPKLGEPGGGDA